MSEPIPQDYGRLLGEFKERIRSAQYAALQKVNKDLISLYRGIGEMILGHQYYHTYDHNEKLAPSVRVNRLDAQPHHGELQGKSRERLLFAHDPEVTGATGLSGARHVR